MDHLDRPRLARAFRPRRPGGAPLGLPRAADALRVWYLASDDRDPPHYRRDARVAGVHGKALSVECADDVGRDPGPWWRHDDDVHPRPRPVHTRTASGGWARAGGRGERASRGAPAS